MIRSQNRGYLDFIGFCDIRPSQQERAVKEFTNHKDYTPGDVKKIKKYATKEDGKVVNYEKLVYPPIALTVQAGGDQATLISAPKKLWGGDGILENAKAAVKKK